MYTTKELAEMFKVTERTIKNWIANGEIKTVKIGRTIRISEYEVERLKRGE